GQRAALRYATRLRPGCTQYLDSVFGGSSGDERQLSRYASSRTAASLARTAGRLCAFRRDAGRQLACGAAAAVSWTDASAMNMSLPEGPETEPAAEGLSETQPGQPGADSHER